MFRMKISEIEDHIENKIAPLKYSLLGDENGLLFGMLDSEVTAIIVCWSPTLRVIEKAIQNNANLIISHEWLIYEYGENKWIEREKRTFSKIPNLKRLGLLTKHNISVIKHHSNWDFAPRGIADSFGECLGLNNLVKKGKIIRVYEERPKKIKKLAKDVAEKLDLPHVLVSGNLEKEVRYIGTAAGGLGQILTFADDFVDTQAEIVIFGEMLEYNAIYTLESGFAYIATSHEASERPGMIKLSQLLRKEFPQIHIQYVDSGVLRHFV